jgi:hypothetical protein
LAAGAKTTEHRWSVHHARAGVSSLSVLPAGGLRLYREGVEPSGSLRKVSGYIAFLLSRISPDARVVDLKAEVAFEGRVRQNRLAEGIRTPDLCRAIA